jgi:hypothetical protein
MHRETLVIWNVALLIHWVNFRRIPSMRWETLRREALGGGRLFPRISMRTESAGGSSCSCSCSHPLFLHDWIVMYESLFS